MILLNAILHETYLYYTKGIKDGQMHILTSHYEHGGGYQSLYLPTDAQKICFKRMLQFTLKQLLHVSVQSPSSGSVLFELVKVTVLKIIC
jgi:hypothetical protein